MADCYKHRLKLTPKFSLEKGNAPEITLSSGKETGEEVLLGRSDITGITDKRCSREHTKLTIDTTSDELVVRQLGSNSSCVIYKGEEIILSKHDVKRLPLTKMSTGNNEGYVIYLIHRDMLYGYNIVVKTEKKGNNAVTRKEQSDIVDSEMGGKKRASSTLDSFIIKKAKVDEVSFTRLKTFGSVVEGSWSEPTPLVYLYNPSELKSSSRIAGFDMDGTLITTNSGAKWPKNKDDWKFLLPSVPEKLRSLHADGYTLVIFTNQAGIARGSQSAKDIQHKVESIIRAIGIPMKAMIAGTRNGPYRKPFTGMWTHICTEDNGGISVDSSACVYVGDAAGRVANWQPSKKKDFSNSDRLFALNAGIKFSTPESFFKGEKEGKFELPEFKPCEALKINNLLEPSSSKMCSDSQEIILMVGFPGSGKSYVSTKYLSAYQRINRDILGSWQKCVARCDAEIKAGKSVVVDNTNPDQASRARYLEVAKKYKIPVRCFLMLTSYKQSRHNEVYRQLTDSKHKTINEMVVNSYKSKYSEPSSSEGFSEIVKVNVVLKFDNDKQRELYSMYLLDK